MKATIARTTTMMPIANGSGISLRIFASLLQSLTATGQRVYMFVVLDSEFMRASRSPTHRFGVTVGESHIDMAKEGCQTVSIVDAPPFLPPSGSADIIDDRCEAADEVPCVPDDVKVAGVPSIQVDAVEDDTGFSGSGNFRQRPCAWLLSEKHPIVAPLRATAGRVV
jgi:hypothetical protein